MAEIIDQTPIERLKRWRDIGNGPAGYTAGDRQFADDVIAVLFELEECRDNFNALQKALVGETGLSAILEATRLRAPQPLTSPESKHD